MLIDMSTIVRVPVVRPVTVKEPIEQDVLEFLEYVYSVGELQTLPLEKQLSMLETARTMAETYYSVI